MEAATEVNAKKTKINGDDVWQLVAKVNEIYAARGKKVVHFNMKVDQPEQEELAKVLLGPTGNLRAPALRKGKTLVVGFNEDTYADVFGG